MQPYGGGLGNPQQGRGSAEICLCWLKRDPKGAGPWKCGGGWFDIPGEEVNPWQRSEMRS